MRGQHDRMSDFSVAITILLSGLLSLLGCSAVMSTKPMLHRMGDRVEVGSLVYRIIEVEWRAQLGTDSQIRTAQNRFVIVRLSITNSAASEAEVPAMQLIAHGNRLYKEVRDVTGIPDWLGILRRLAPAETLFGRVVFDVPPGDYLLRVSEDSLNPDEARSALIEIPWKLAESSVSTGLDRPGS